MDAARGARRTSRRGFRGWVGTCQFFASGRNATKHPSCRRPRREGDEGGGLEDAPALLPRASASSRARPRDRKTPPASVRAVCRDASRNDMSAPLFYRLAQTRCRDHEARQRDARCDDFHNGSAREHDDATTTRETSRAGERRARCRRRPRRIASRPPPRASSSSRGRVGVGVGVIIVRDFR